MAISSRTTMTEAAIPPALSRFGEATEEIENTQFLVTQEILMTMGTHYTMFKGQYCSFLIRKWTFKKIIY